MATHTHTKTQKIISKGYVFLIEKYVEDARQDEKHVPDLLESIMRPTDPGKEELRQKLVKISQNSSKIKKMKVSTFGFRKTKVFPPEANTTFSPSRFSARHGLPHPNKSNIWPR